MMNNHQHMTWHELGENSHLFPFPEWKSAGESEYKIL